MPSVNLIAKATKLSKLVHESDKGFLVPSSSKPGTFNLVNLDVNKCSCESRIFPCSHVLAVRYYKETKELNGQ